MAVLEDLSEEEAYLLAIILDQSGIDLAEFSWQDHNNIDNLFRCYPYQYHWYRDDAKKQIDQCARAVGKSVGIQMRAFAFPFSNPGAEMLITAPELIHLDPVTSAVEERIEAVRIGREMLLKRNGKTGFMHKPFSAQFNNGAMIRGRIPQKDGKGVKGQHPRILEMDEAQDYPALGWMNLIETLRYGDETSKWRAHGVSKGPGDHFHRMSQSSEWSVHRITAMHRPDWSDEERRAKGEMYLSRDHPDYRRNVLGLHGDASNPLFVLARLMQCVDQNPDSDYNVDIYQKIQISDEELKDWGVPISELLPFNGMHLDLYHNFWVGMDIGITNHPSEILVFGESKKDGKSLLTLCTRITLQRISTSNQMAALKHVADFYTPQAFSIDRTGLGLPIYQMCVEGEDGTPPHPMLSRSIKGYNFSGLIVVGFEPQEEDDGWDDDPMAGAIKANVLEYSSDSLRMLIDKERIRLPYDTALLKEFQGQRYYINRGAMNAYGKKQFAKGGGFHALDAAKMAVLGYQQREIDTMITNIKSNAMDAVLIDYTDGMAVF
jgi:hypothetical protein